MIYTEVVHLNADDKVLIEVLDGRSIRLTFDVHPLEVIYQLNSIGLESKKVVAINVDGQPYLHLDVYNKVFVTINDRLHTYDIVDIDQLGDNCFQCHTMPRTKSSFFITPMYGDNRTEMKWGQYFVNTFLSDNSVIILYRYFGIEDFKVFEHKMCKHPLYQKLIDYDVQHVAFQFKIPQTMEDNVRLFSDGKYSKMSNSYKEQILRFHGLSKETTLGRVLFKSDERRKQLELDLGVSIPPDVELYDKPDEREIYEKQRVEGATCS